jgi:PAS domain S-box-containing protein
LTSFSDIPAENQTEDALRKSEERYRTLFETMAQGIVYQDGDGKIVSANPAAERILGITLDQMQGRTSMDPRWRAIHEDDSDFPGETHPAMVALKTGKEVRNVVMGVFDPKRGKHNWININAIPQFRSGETKPFQVYTTFEDITVRRQAERALQESENRFRSLVEGTAAGVGIIDLEGRLTYVNKALADLMGYTTQELSGQPFVNYLHREDAEKVLTTFLRGASSGNEAPDFEFRAIRKDGSSRYLWTRPTRLTAQSQTIGFEAIIVDITDRKVAEETLRESEERYRIINQNMSEGVWLMDMNLKPTYISPSVTRARGYTLEELYALPLDKQVTPDSLKLALETLQEALPEVNSKQTARPLTRTLELEFYRKDGSTFWSENTFTLLMNSNDEPAGILAVSRDITERKRMEDELKRYSTQLEQLVAERTRELAASKDYAENLIQTANAMVVGLDISGNIRVFNQAAERITGYTGRELKGRNWFEVIVPKDRYPEVWKEFERLTTGGLPKNFENPILTKDGHERYIVWQNNDVREQGQIVGTISFGIDITERKLLEEALLKSQRMAAIGELAAMVGHDLRNPLTGITGATYYLNKKLGPKTNKKEREMLQLIEQEIGHADKIINDLLEYSKEIRLELTQTGAKSITEDALKSVKIPNKIRVLNSTKQTPRIELDAKQMRRVLVNLIRNAVDAMPSGGTLRITSRESNDNLELIIADTGEGMTSETLERLWSPLYTTKSKGIGLGLPTVKRLVEAHGGSITVETKPSKGSTFTVTLPLHRKMGLKAER